MNNAKHILIAVDDSEAAYRAVTYVGRIIGGRQDFRVCLLHALPPLPPELLEFGGSSDPQQEEQGEACIKAEQASIMASATLHPLSLSSGSPRRTEGHRGPLVGRKPTPRPEQT